MIECYKNLLNCDYEEVTDNVNYDIIRFYGQFGAKSQSKYMRYRGEKMQIVEKKIEEIKPYENNPRKNDDAVKYVANSIKEFGFKVPIVIDKNNVIVAGHTRYKASKKLGIDIVPCVVADDLTQKQINAFRLVDNKTAEMAVWDDGKLKEELEQIFDINMKDFGFDDIEKEIQYEDLSENLIDKFEVIIVKCTDAMNMQETYEWLIAEGYECRLSTL